jgi:hypothetical protein
VRDEQQQDEQNCERIVKGSDSSLYINMNHPSQGLTRLACRLKLWELYLSEANNPDAMAARTIVRDVKIEYQSRP